jgi:hypothetical protein
VPLVKQIVEMARARRLLTTYTYSFIIVDNDVSVDTSVFAGYYPPLPAKNKRPTEENFRADLHITYTSQAVRTRLNKEDVYNISTPTFSMANPVLTPTVASYAYDEWVKVIQSLTGDISCLCPLAIDAEINNSNQVSKAGFKYWKYNKQRPEYQKNIGTFTMLLWEQYHASNSLFIHDLEHIQQRVNEHNARRTKRSRTVNTDHNDDLIEQGRDIQWDNRAARAKEALK